MAALCLLKRGRWSRQDQGRQREQGDGGHRWSRLANWLARGQRPTAREHAGRDNLADHIRVPQKRGRPKTRPKEVVADKACESADFRRSLRRRGIQPTLPTFERRPRKKPRRGRPLRVSAAYRQRWTVERCFAWMDNCRRLVVRYERHLHLYKAFCLVAIILWCINRILK